ncbi:hypothetical protein ACSTD6_20270 [Vibrio vulnificus]|uniref:hypothetical protein n=1 Tax=Vibrio vulnificus TaxID=672 RepID=UPI003EDA73A3
MKFKEIDNDVEFIKFKSFSSFFSCCYSLLRTKVVIFHSPFLLSFPLIFLSWIFNKKIVLFMWDVYPVLISGRRYDTSLRRRIFDKIENMAIDMASLIYVPSDDFRLAGFDNIIKTRNFWHCDEVNNSKRDDNKDKIKVIFAGQINETRDLTSAFYSLKSYFVDVDFELIIASPNEVPYDLINNKEVRCIGSLTASELTKVYNECHFGLVSLNLNLSKYAFPSKTFDYISTGLPILYYGPVDTVFCDYLIKTKVGVCLELCNVYDADSYRYVVENFKCLSKVFIRKTCLDSNSVKKMFDEISL